MKLYVNRSVLFPFEKAVEAALEARRDRRTRTVYDFRYFTRRKVRAMTPQECAGYIEQAFDTPRQRQKARLILSGVFGTAVKRGWCEHGMWTKGLWSMQGLSGDARDN